MSPVTLQTEGHKRHAGPPVHLVDDRRGSFGMAVFIASEATLFAMLFAAYYYLGPGNHRWSVEEPPKLHFALPMLAILIVSSGVIYWGEEKVKKQEYGAGRSALIATIILGLVFLVLSYFEYSEHLKTVTPRTDSYGSIFYTITSLHLAHLTLGLLMLFWVLFLPRWSPAQYTPHRPYHNAAMYWHFVDTIWLIVVLVLYVWPNIFH